MDFGETLNRVGEVDQGIVWLAVPMLLGQAMLSAFKWRLILSLSEIRVRFFLILKTYLQGNFISLFLPTSFGGDVYRVVRINQESGRLGDSASSVLFDRLTGLFALVTIAVVSYMLLPGMEYKMVLLPLYLTGITAFFAATSAAVIKRLDGLAPPAFRKFLHPLRAFREYRRVPRVFLAVLVIAFVFQFNIVVVNKIFCAALGINIPFTLLLAVVPIIYLTEVLPISINGIGVRDGAFVFFFSYLGYAQEEGLAVALLVLLFRYLVGTVGGLIFLVESLRSGGASRPTAGGSGGSATKLTSRDSNDA